MIATITSVEFEKIARKKSSLIIVALVILFQIVLAVAGYKMRMKEMELGTGFQVAAFSIQFVLQILTLVVLAISSISLSRELSSGTVKTVLARNINRRDLIIGKFVALFLSGFLVLLLTYILGLLAGKVFGGLVALKDGNYLLCSAGSLTWGYFASLLLVIPPLTTLISFGILISVLVRGAGGAVGTGIISFFFLQMLSQVDQIDKYCFTKYLKLPIDSYYKMTEGIFLTQKSSIYWNLGVSSICTLIFLGLAIGIFCKKDIWR